MSVSSTNPRPVTGAKHDVWLDAVRSIVAAVRASDVADFELLHGDFHLRMRRRIIAGSAPVSSQSAETKSAPEDANLHRVLAPLTGIFYRSPSPSAKAFANEGDWVDADTVIGLVETMKIFNEVTAERSGRVVRLLAENGQLVHAGEPLVVLEPGERPAAGTEPGL
jgi:acetyl-CoA carboxylase biotin carboxyl carrier protein